MARLLCTIGMLLVAASVWGQSLPTQVNPCWTGTYRASVSEIAGVVTNTYTLTAGTPVGYYSSAGGGGEWWSSTYTGVMVFSLDALQVPGYRLQSAILYYTYDPNAIIIWKHKQVDITASPTVALYSGASESVTAPIAIDGSWAKWDATSYIQSDIVAGFTCSALIFDGVSDKSPYTNATAQNAHLALTFAPVPEPSSVLALLTAMGGFAGLVVRKRR